jgi:hypothetical protein
MGVPNPTSSLRGQKRNKGGWDVIRFTILAAGRETATIRPADRISRPVSVSRAFLCTSIRFPQGSSFSNFSFLGRSRMDNLLRHHI